MKTNKKSAFHAATQGDLFGGVEAVPTATDEAPATVELQATTLPDPEPSTSASAGNATTVLPTFDLPAPAIPQPVASAFAHPTQVADTQEPEDQLQPGVPAIELPAPKVPRPSAADFSTKATQVTDSQSTRARAPRRRPSTNPELRTLRTHEDPIKSAPELTSTEITRLRKELKVSRAVLAAYLRTNARTLENWEQGRAKPNAQAALLIHLVRQYPDTIQRLAEL